MTPERIEEIEQEIEECGTTFCGMAMRELLDELHSVGPLKDVAREAWETWVAHGECMRTATVAKLANGCFVRIQIERDIYLGRRFEMSREEYFELLSRKTAEATKDWPEWKHGVLENSFRSSNVDSRQAVRLDPKAENPPEASPQKDTKS